MSKSNCIYVAKTSTLFSFFVNLQTTEFFILSIQSIPLKYLLWISAFFCLIINGVLGYYSSRVFSVPLTMIWIETSQASSSVLVGQSKAGYDFSPESHDHFICSECDSLQDIKVPDSVRCQIECQLDGCCFDGPLVITGVCQQCKNRRRNYGIN